LTIDKIFAERRSEAPKDVAEAESVMESLPLAKANMMDHEYITVGPLKPLGLLLVNPSTKQ